MYVSFLHHRTCSPWSPYRSILQAAGWPFDRKGLLGKHFYRSSISSYFDWFLFGVRISPLCLPGNPLSRFSFASRVSEALRRVPRQPCRNCFLGNLGGHSNVGVASYYPLGIEADGLQKQYVRFVHLIEAVLLGFTPFLLVVFVFLSLLSQLVRLARILIQGTRWLTFKSKTCSHRPQLGQVQPLLAPES